MTESLRLRLFAPACAFGAAWNGANIGPLVRPLQDDFGVSLGVLGLLSGTMLFGGSIVGLLIAPKVAERLGVAGSMRAACGTLLLGNLLFAASPTFAVIALARFALGIAFGLAIVLSAVFARAAAGVGLVGVVGAAIQGGIAAGLLVGGLVIDAGLGWRPAVLIAAAVGVIPLLVFPGNMRIAERPVRPPHLLRAELRSRDLWRLSLLYRIALSVPAVIGAWLVYYLETNGVGTGVAGALAFSLFILAAVARFAGGRLAAIDVPPSVLAGLAPLSAAAGLALVALDQSVPTTVVAVVLMGIGFGLPYAVMMMEGQSLYPEFPLAPVSLLSVIAATGPPIVIPLVGLAMENGRGRGAFIVLAAFVAVSGLVNLRPPEREVEPPV